MQTPEINQAILATLAYFDLFDYPLTYPELYRYLWRSPKTTLAEVIQATRQLSPIVEHNGFIMFRDRTELARIRQHRYVESEVKWNKRRWFIRLLSYLPGVEAIFLTNTFAYHNVKDDSDIDVLIVTRPRSIWATRFYTTAIAKLLRIRPKSNKTKNAVCLSFYVTPNGLRQLPELRCDDNDALEAYWIIQAMPVYDPHNYSEQIGNNRWVQTVLPNNQPVKQHQNRSIPHTWLHHVSHMMGRFFLWNRLLKKIQLWILPQQLKRLAGPLATGIVVLDDNLLKFHTRDPRPKVLERWQNTMRQYQQ